VSDTDLSGTVIDGRYQVIEPIAEGAMGSVYRGERLKLGRAVAIKVMHQELPDELSSRQRFEREAKLMALLEHPNCVSVIDFGVHDDKPFLVMDLVRGTSLLDLLEKTGQLEVTRAADIVRQVLSGLAHAHELGIVHRDIKPANIMISEKAGLGSQVRILDFGLARLLESSTKLTTGIVVGTPNYMAPEQCKGSDVDARTDIYACGVLLFEMLTGRKPFVADDPIAVVRKHLLEAPPTLASVEPRIDFGELEAVVAKALAKAPADRYDSAVAMSKAVEAAAAKHSKMSAAALFARAVPEGAAGAVGTQQATMSGWTVPPDARSSAIPASGGTPPAGAGPTSGVANVGDASGPFTGLAKVDESNRHTGPNTGSGFVGQSDGFTSSQNAGSGVAPGATAAASSKGPSSSVSLALDAALTETSQSAGATSASGAASAAASAATESTPPARSLPPLPQAAPYVPPPGVGAAAPVAAPPSNGTATDAAHAAPGSGGMPNVALDVPATRPSTLPPTRLPGAAADRPIPQLPFTKKQLMIAGGGLLALIILIAVLAGGDSKKAPAKKSGGSTSTATNKEPAVPADPVPQTIERAKSLMASERFEEAIEVLKKGRKAHPDSAELAFVAGKAYFAQLWWSDGVDNFRDAVQLDPSYKENPELLKAVLKGFLTTPDVDDRIVDFMREIGTPMRPYLEETAEKHPKKNLRARARAELNAR
jgi:serine/threonine protein kinase